MSKALAYVDTDDFIIFDFQTYNIEFLQKCKHAFNELVLEGLAKGSFDDEKWEFYELKWFGLNFKVNPLKYAKHFGMYYGISKDSIIKMLKCYILSIRDFYITQSLSQNYLKGIIKFLENWDPSGCKPLTMDLNPNAVCGFLGFISTPTEDILNIRKFVEYNRPSKYNNQRELKPVINYMVIDNEIKHMYSQHLDDETFVKWFPLFFWTQFTFIIPTRATEMLVTPFDCLQIKDGDAYLNLRKTLLKHRKILVYHNVEKDYKVFTFKLKVDSNIKALQKYIELTKDQDRRFLFRYEKNMVNEMISLQSFNRLLEEFIATFIIGNSKYDYAKYAANIDEFSIVTAGDSRPIAMANLYFSGAGEDICMQLAGHMNVDTSAHYFTNISETILGSAIIELNNSINKKTNFVTFSNNNMSIAFSDSSKSQCLSPKRQYDSSNLDDCENYLEDCMGCQYYHPAKEEFDRDFNEKKRTVDKTSKELIKVLNKILKCKNRDTSLRIEELFLIVQKDAHVYKIVSDKKTKEILIKWENYKNMTTAF